MKIIDDEEYEKNKTFTIVLEEPILLEVGQRHGERRSVFGCCRVLVCNISISMSIHFT